MEFLTLNNGLRLPLVGFGTWQVRGPAGRRCLLEALELGYRLFDTAQMYENEADVGAALRDSGLPRSEIFVTSKLHGPCNGYLLAQQGIARSLEALGTDYIDLLLIHEPYDHAPEMYEAMKEAYRQGLVRAIGVSNFDLPTYQAFVRCCGVVPAVDQVESHVYHAQLALRQALVAQGTQMQSWASFTEGRRNIFAEPELCAIGRPYGKTAAQVALRYLVQNGIAVIPKTIHRERMAQNLALFDFALSAQDLARIAALDKGQSLFGWY